MTTEKRLKLQVWILILVVFILGGAAGASIDALYRQREQKIHAAAGNSPTLERMMRELDLSDQQVDQLRSVFQGTRKEIAQNPAFKEIRDRTDIRIRAILTADQWQKYTELKARRDAERAAEANK
jgi:Spy/CpxP family protein refolding chaperone